jgi:hypothetical protein
MEAGRELDALVAEKVMGWHREDVPQPGRSWYGGIVPNQPPPQVWVDPDGEQWDKPWPWSTEIAASWAVVEKLGDQGLSFGLVSPGAKAESTGWSALFAGWAQAKDIATAPLVICLAGLKAVGYVAP